jgi:hypothetical protein
MIEARHPLLIFSRVFSTIMRPSLLSSLLALAAKMVVGGKKWAPPPMPLPPPTGGRDTPEIKESCCRHPNCNVYINRATRDGSNNAWGWRQGGSSVNNNNDDNGGNNNNYGGTTKKLDEVGDEFEAPLERDKAEFGPSEVMASPLLVLMQHINTSFYHGGGAMCPSIT